MADVSMTPKRALHLTRVQAAIKPQLRRSLGKIRTIIRREIRRNLSGRLLNVRSGTLRAGLLDSIEVTKVGSRIVDGSLTFGYDLDAIPYARIHELGGWAGRNHATKLRKRGYMRRALVTKKHEIRQELSQFLVRISR